MRTAVIIFEFGIRHQMQIIIIIILMRPGDLCAMRACVHASARLAFEGMGTNIKILLGPKNGGPVLRTIYS